MIKMPGGVILFDNYSREGTSGESYHRDTVGADNFIQGKNIEVKRFS